VIGVALLLLLSAFVFLKAPKLTLAVLPVLFIFQDACVAIVGGRGSSIGAVIQNTDEAALTAIVVVMGAVTLLTRRRLYVPRWVYWYSLFVIAAAVSIALQGSGWRRGALGLLLLSKGFIFAFVIQQFEWQVEDVKQWLRLQLGALVIVLLFAIPDLLSPTSFRAFIGFDEAVDYRSGLPSVGSLLGHPGPYGWFMAVGVMLALAHILSGRSRAWYVPLSLFMGGMALSLRRKPILGVLASAVIVVFLFRHGTIRYRARGALIALGLIALPLAFVFFPIVLQGVYGYLSVDALTAQARTALYAGALLLGRDHFPFGVGIGRYGSYGSVVDYSPIYYEFGFDKIFGMSPTYGAFIQDTFWPQILGETGFIGLIGYAGALLALFLDALRSARNDDTPTLRPLYLAALLVGIEIMFESVAAPTFTVPAQACLSLGLLGLAQSIRRSRSDATREPAEGGSSHDV
jgi:hypothetical protein